MARRLRRSSTETERKLWSALRELRLPFKVRRQHPIGSHIADFAIPARRLVIEIDGGQHAGAQAKDKLRTLALEARGYRVIRFWNNEVTENLDGVLQSILDELRHTPTSP